jgi:hypothetical protein
MLFSGCRSDKGRQRVENHLEGYGDVVVARMYFVLADCKKYEFVVIIPRFDIGTRVP